MQISLDSHSHYSENAEKKKGKKIRSYRED